MANLFDLQQQIVELQNSNTLATREIGVLNGILATGKYSFDSSGQATVSIPGGITYLVSELNFQIADYTQQIDDNTKTILNIQTEIPLASTTQPTHTSTLRAQTVLRDYRHAARIYTDSEFRLSPKYGFLFYVEFDFNPLITNISNRATQELGMIVKSCGLPKFTIDTKIHNAYNRKNIVQNKISYDPISIVFRDDQAENVKQFWYDYYSYFYRDPDYADATYNAPHKYQPRTSFDWGYSPRQADGYVAPFSLLEPGTTAFQPYQYIQAIRIYQLFQGNFSEYQLINPIITGFKHGDLDVSTNDVMHTDMTIQYEAVKYLEGKVTKDIVGGFVDLHYDTTPSPNGGTPQYQTNDSTITDLANSQTVGQQMYDTGLFQLKAQEDKSSTAQMLAGVTNGTAAGGSNAGGYSIPNIGMLTAGVTGSAVLGRQLQSAGIGLAGSLTSGLAGGLVGAVAKGLGPQGTSILGLAAAAIANPSQALRTVENMALSIVMGIGVNMLNQGVTSLVQGVSTDITKFVGDNIRTPIVNAWGEGVQWFKGQQLSLEETLNGSAGISTNAYQNFQNNPVEIKAENFGADLSDI
jgi:hypothetical protein